MNERTIQLYKQASKWVCENEPGVVEETHLFYELMPAKFAELIVKECISQIEIEKGNPYRNMGDENRYGIGACVESIRRIKQHFGVE